MNNCKRRAEMQLYNRVRHRNKGFVKSGGSLACVLIFLCACGTDGNAPAQSETAAAPSAALEPSATAAPEPTAYTFVGQAVCTAKEFVNIREKPDTGATITGSLPAGASAGVIRYYDRWAHIVYNGVTGFVSREYIINSREPAVPVPAGDWAAILVNPTHRIPKDFEVSLAGFEGGRVDARILEICRQMFADAREDGVSLMLVDAYRSYERQDALYRKKVNSYMAKGYSRANAEVRAAAVTARPDTSEHQTGLALDIVTPSYRVRDRGFADTKAFQWLNANAHNYGFTLRYKEDKVGVTKVIYEPWHWRFVGAVAATEMKQSGECFEEYLDALG